MTNVEPREVTLMKVMYKFLKKQDNSPYVLNLLEEIDFWDDVECDGYCLMDDIKYHLEDLGYEV